jgi:protein TonB
MSRAASEPMFPYWKAVVVAAVVHLFFFIAASLTLVTPPCFGVTAGAGGIEVSLVAAPAKTPDTKVPHEEEVSVPPSDPDDMAVVRPEVPAIPPPPAPKLTEPKPPLPKVDAVKAPSVENGTAASSSSGNNENIGPRYLRNPRPPYPAADAKARHEGVVVLKVLVDAEGHPAEAKITRGSGYEGLDATARDWILKKWRFEPARAAGIPVQKWVDIPVRFDVTD